MKSKMTHTTVFRCFAFGALGISLASFTGCHCKSSNWNPFSAQHVSRAEYSLDEKQESGVGEISSDLNQADLKNAPQERSGLLVDLKNALSPSGWRTRIENEVEESPTTDTVAELSEEPETEQATKASATIQSSRRTALNSIAAGFNLQQGKEASRLDVEESESKTATAEDKDQLANTEEPKKLAKPDAESPATSSKIEPVSQQLKPVARFEPASTTKQNAASSSIDSVTTEPVMQPIVKERSSDRGFEAGKGQNTPALPPPAQSATRPQPMALPRTAVSSIQRAETKHLTSDPAVTSQPFCHSPDSPEQPLALELRDGAWPVSGDVDPVSRAYETHKKSKSQFRHLDSQTSVQPNPPSNPPMHLIGHRRRVADAKPTDEVALLHDRSNWVPVQEGNKQITGLELQATPKSAHVAISPLVQLTLGSPHSTDHVRQPVEQSPQMEIQPRDWLQKPDFDNLLPLDDVGPIIDLPVSNSIRRLTVRPDETGKEKQTIER